MKKQTKAKRSKGVLRTVVLCIIGVFLGINVYMFNAQRIVGNSIPMPFGYGAAVVLSGSMEPELSKDDLIFVKETDNLEIGDVVVFQDSGTLIVHRVVDINENFVLTKGDANSGFDAPVEKSSIKGKVVGSIPFVGFIINVLKSPLGIVSILILAFLLLELPYRGNDDSETEKIKAEIARLKGDNEDSE